MAIHWHDVTIPVRDEMTVWPGDCETRLTPVSRIDDGSDANITAITMSAHAGTHIDAPYHFENDGRRSHELDSALFFGDALVLDMGNAEMVTADALPTGPLPDRVLFRTRNSKRPVDAPFLEDFVALNPDAANRLVQMGVRLVGVDSLSVAPFNQPGQETHHVLLRRGVLVVEGLRLEAIPAGLWRFVVLPLALQGVDGAPCRAFIGMEGE